MALTSGSRLGPYEVIASIGVGGMGEVFRARDTKLNRDVALKVLPDLFASDPDRLARFTREAQTLASLNHPNIAHIHGLEESTGVRALVMELVEGEDLSQRIARGAITLDEALPIAKQIVEALEAAHELGIIHRDLKPANVKIRQDGAVKVLDFGLAKALDPVGAASPIVSQSPTITTPAMTQVGVILGTAAYMSPEQARGKPVDRRGDIWAFGCVLYEMLTGRRPFDAGETVSDAVAAILRSDPDWTALPANTPAHVRTLLRRCLQKDPNKRLPHIGIARLEIDEGPADPVFVTSAKASAPAPRSRWRLAAAIGFAVLTTAALTATAMWYLRPSPRVALSKFQFTLPPGELLGGVNRHVVAVSPDGSEIVLVGTPGRLYRRSLADVDVEPIQGTEIFQRVLSPTFSPDGRSIAFWAGSDRTLKRITLSGGAAVTLCRAEPPSGMSWGPDGITFGQMAGGILRVSESGGKPEVLVKVSAGALAQSPQVLPDRDHVLFTLAVGPPSDYTRFDTARVVVHSLKTGEQKTLVEGGTDARYLPTGHIVYASGGNLLAVGFDLDRLEPKGTPVPVVQGVRRAVAAATGAAQFSVSATGSLVFVPGQTLPFSASDLALTDRQGSVRALKLPPGSYEYPRVSPDGTRIAFGSDDGREAAVWVHDLSGTTAPRKLTFGGQDRHPLWSLDSKRVTFQSDGEGTPGIFWQVADGSASAERLTTAAKGEAHTPESWSPTDGRLLYTVRKDSAYSLWVHSLQDRKGAPLGKISSLTPTTAAFSPDGRWLAYSVNRTGELNVIYLEPYPSTSARYQLPETGVALNAHHPLWSRDGRELLFVAQIGTLWAVPVTTSPTIAFGTPVAVPRRFPVANPMTPRTFDITRDGKTLGVLTEGQSPSQATDQIQVVLNWHEELKRLVPPR